MFVTNAPSSLFDTSFLMCYAIHCRRTGERRYESKYESHSAVIQGCQTRLIISSLKTNAQNLRGNTKSHTIWNKFYWCLAINLQRNPPKCYFNIFWPQTVIQRSQILSYLATLPANITSAFPWTYQKEDRRLQIPTPSCTALHFFKAICPPSQRWKWHGRGIYTAPLAV